MEAPTIVVIGAGVIGLSAAIKLQTLFQHGYTILVLARDWPSSIPGAPPSPSIDYASMWAGAHVRPIPATTPQLCREAALLRDSVAEFALLGAAEPWCGLTPTLGLEMLDEPDEGYLSLDASTFGLQTGLAGFRKLSDDGDVPEGVKLAFEYQTFCINAPVYCQFLLRKLLLGGAKALHRDLGSEWEAFSAAQDVRLVVNASGTGFADGACFPTRGQTVVTNMTHVTRTVTRQNRDGTWSFLIPRFLSGGTIVGGTKEPNNWNTQPDAATRQQLLDGGLVLEPYAREAPARQDWKLNVVADIVGRRPTRTGGLRIEVEHDDNGRAVLHAYGAGGRGYELSWGIANEVARLAERLSRCYLDRHVNE